MPRPLIPHRAAVILDSAEELIGARGYDSTTVADIAEHAGVAKGAVYREYPSKEAVLDALLTRATRRLVAGVRERLAAESPSGAGPAGLALAYRLGFESLRREPLVLAFMYGRTDVLGSYVRDRTDDRYSQRLAWVDDYVGELQRAGAVRSDVDPDAVAVALSAITVGLISIGPTVGGLTESRLDAALNVILALVERGLDERSGPADHAQATAAHIRLLDRIDNQPATTKESAP